MPVAKFVRDLIGRPPVALQQTASVLEAARQMRDENVGAVVVLDPADRPCGIVTDRDITIRAVANMHDVGAVTLGEICTTDLVKLSPDDSVERAVITMRERSVRRLLVVDCSDRAVGVISLGDLAVERDSWSALGQISAAPPNG
jgi:signal-transduction protein with cAMP-binding, CBS, and nucleotidyltransferase domain